MRRRKAATFTVAVTTAILLLFVTFLNIPFVSAEDDLSGISTEKSTEAAGAPSLAASESDQEQAPAQDGSKSDLSEADPDTDADAGADVPKTDADPGSTGAAKPSLKAPKGAPALKAPAITSEIWNATGGWTILDEETGSQIASSSVSFHGEYYNSDGSFRASGDWNGGEASSCAPFGPNTYQTTKVTPSNSAYLPCEFKVFVNDSGEAEVEMLNGSKGSVEVTVDADRNEYTLTIKLAKKKLDPGNPPATVTTEDSRAEGIKLTLFDYDLTDDPVQGDTWNNSPTSPLTNYWPTAGINSDMNLKFFGHGGDPELSGNSNRFTGESTARQGIVESTLGSDGYPKMTEFGGQSLAPLFNESGNDSKTVYSDVNHLFQLDDQGNYVYDSDANYAYYDPSQGSGGDYKVYDGTYQVNESVQNGTPTRKMNVGYFPFDDWNENKDEVSPALDTAYPYNHQHGLKMECDFYIPESGKIEGDDIVFRFSGDDDAWLFIDDVLVMDIGGLHEPTGGSINLTTGDVNIDSAVDVVPYDSSTTIPQTIGTENNISDIFAAAGKTWDPAGKHTMKFFYLERGGCYSNLALATNIWKVTGVRFNVNKVWNDEKDHSGDSVTVQLYADGKEVSGKTLTLNAKNNWKDAFNNLPPYDEDGNTIKYTVKEVGTDNCIATYSKGGEVVKEKTYWVPIDASELEDGETYAITAPNWTAGDEPRILSGGSGSLTSSTALVSERAVPGENETMKDGDGTYDRFLKKAPSAPQLFTATKLSTDGNASGDFWMLSNANGNITLSGHLNWTPWWQSIDYSFTNTTDSGWVQDTNTNYQNALTVTPESGGTAMISSAQWWGNSYGGLDRGEQQYLYMQDGTTPAATNNQAWCGHYTFWKQVTAEETVELPGDWTITNSPAGDIKISKTVEGNDAQKSNPYTFTITLDEKLNGKFGDLTFTDGEATFTLKDGESKTAEDLPVGTKYTVKEDSSSAEAVVAGGTFKSSITGESGTVEDGKTVEVKAVNTFTKSTPPVPPEPPKTGDVSDPVRYIVVGLSCAAMLAALLIRRKLATD